MLWYKERIVLFNQMLDLILSEQLDTANSEWVRLGAVVHTKRFL